MATVFLTSAAPPSDPTWSYPYDELDRMKESARRDRFGVHQLTDDPDAADLILYVDNVGTPRHFLTLWSSELFRRYPEKCFLFSKDDYAIPFLPGVYASLPQRWSRTDHTRSGSYLKAFGHNYVPFRPLESPTYLYSFIGKSTTHPVRTALLQLSHPRQYFKDTAPLWPYGDLSPDARRSLEDNYRQVSHESAFILAPRGVGTSSIRLFESLRMGRAPVIISNDWVPPEGPDWNAFSVRISEEEIDTLPSRLESIEDQAAEMGMRAREAWTEWFSVEATFHRVVDWCLDIQSEQGASPSRRPYLKALPQCLHPSYFRMVGSAVRNHFSDRGSSPSSGSPTGASSTEKALSKTG